MKLLNTELMIDMREYFVTIINSLLHVLAVQIPWIRIQTRQRDALSDKRILVAMDSWPPWCRHPIGHYVKTLGEKGAKATETEVSVVQSKHFLFLR